MLTAAADPSPNLAWTAGPHASHNTRWPQGRGAAAGAADRQTTHSPSSSSSSSSCRPTPPPPPPPPAAALLPVSLAPQPRGGESAADGGVPGTTLEAAVAKGATGGAAGRGRGVAAPGRAGPTARGRHEALGVRREVLRRPAPGFGKTCA